MIKRVVPEIKEEDYIEKIVNKETIFEGNIFTVEKYKVETAHGNESFREVIHHNGGAAILAMTDDEKFIFEYQYRVATREIILEIPAGKLEKNEDPLECAKRELEEETAYLAETWQKLGAHYVSPGYDDEMIHLFLARNLKKGSFNLDPDEKLLAFTVPVEEARNMLLAGEFKDSKTALALSLYFMKN